MTPKEKPILFSGPMVRAILEGHKTMTRRLVRWPKWCDPSTAEEDGDRFVAICKSTGCFSEIAPPYAGGDVLWVRETFAIQQNVEDEPPPFNDGRPTLRRPEGCDDGPLWMQAHYKATDPAPELAYQDTNEPCVRWKPSIHMPRWASRLTLRVVEVRNPERVQDIGKDGRKAKDVLAEGISERAIAREREWFHPDDSPAIAFKRVWDHVNGDGAWDRNDWVWPIRFEVTP